MIQTQYQLTEILPSAEVIHDTIAIHAAIARMAVEIQQDLATHYPVFMPIMKGGLIVGGHLAVALNFDVEIDYCHATRYRGETHGGELNWIKKPQTNLNNRHVLLVDDILDEGHTLAAVIAYCYQQGAKKVSVAVLCQKQHMRGVPNLVADYVGLIVPDRYVFGFGMDYHEQGRYLPTIYALP